MLDAILAGLKDPNIAAAVTAVATALAAVASLCAIIVSIYGVLTQKKHDRKSVLPIPQVIFGDYENQIYVKIENAGVGPAILKKIEVKNSTTGQTASSIIDQMPVVGPDFVWDTFVRNFDGRAIPPQQSLLLLKFSGQTRHGATINEGSRESAYNQIRMELGGLVISAFVSDVYGDEVPVLRRKLDWFHRRFSDKEISVHQKNVMLTGSDPTVINKSS